MSATTSTKFHCYRVHLRASITVNIGYAEKRSYLIVAETEDQACNEALELVEREGLIPPIHMGHIGKEELL